MLFNSINFLIFFPIVLLVYYVIPKRIRHFWLLISSYYFYMCWNAKYAILIFISTVITYLSGLLIEKITLLPEEKSNKTSLKKVVVAISFLSNLGILFFFKYFNLSASILNFVFSKIHVSFNIPTLDLLLPVGISFYTFQALSYTMDVYRREIYAEKNFFEYALFVSFFPQLVAGPIERSKSLLKQLKKPQKISFEDIQEGFLIMLWGYFLKLVIADRTAIFVDTVYNDYARYTGVYLVIATLLFAVQIYCDFAGYSTIAIGAAKFLGINLMENFDAPYLSKTVGEFWRKWHISLTSWFKDYLYIPLGGSRKGKARKYINKMIVFFASGLWHGASISFIIWGGLNGLYQVLGEMLQPVRNRMVKMLNLNRESFGHKLLSTIVTFFLVDFAWIFFRARSTGEAVAIVKGMMNISNLDVLINDELFNCGLDRRNFYLVLICIAILLFTDYCKHKRISIIRFVGEQDFWFKCIFTAIAISFILTFGIWGSSYSAANFIYFQF